MAAVQRCAVLCGKEGDFLCGGGGGGGGERLSFVLSFLPPSVNGTERDKEKGGNPLNPLLPLFQTPLWRS